MIVELPYSALDTTDMAGLRQLGTSFFRAQSVKRLSYHHYPPLGAPDFKPAIIVVAMGFPDGWVKTYAEKQYFRHDPIVRHSMASTSPFWWSDIADLRDLTSPERDYLKEMESKELGIGLAVPVYGPHNRNGYFGLGFGDHKPEVSAKSLIDLHASCQILHLEYCRILKQLHPKPTPLSIQETSVMRLVALGKTNTMISKELNISASTVETYVRRTFDKLDVHDRMSAALRALSLGLLD